MSHTGLDLSSGSDGAGLMGGGAESAGAGAPFRSSVFNFLLLSLFYLSGWLMETTGL